MSWATVWCYVGYVAVPWTVGLWLLRGRIAERHVVGATWGGLALALAIPLVISDTTADRVDSLGCALSHSLRRAGEAIGGAVGTLLPLLVLPVAIFWGKVALRMNGATTSDDHSDTITDRQQAFLITFIVKVIVTAYVMFGVCNSVGLSVSGVLEFTTIFSLGISWSMRDWMSSTWAGFVLACTTNVTEGTRVRVPNGAAAGTLQVKRMGTLFVECVTTEGTLFLPNNCLVRNGFTVVFTD